MTILEKSKRFIIIIFIYNLELLLICLKILQSNFYFIFV